MLSIVTSEVVAPMMNKIMYIIIVYNFWDQIAMCMILNMTGTAFIIGKSIAFVYSSTYTSNLRVLRFPKDQEAGD